MRKSQFLISLKEETIVSVPLYGSMKLASPSLSAAKPLFPQNPFYVRCIKPNDSKQADIFMRDLAIHQVNRRVSEGLTIWTRMVMMIGTL